MTLENEWYFYDTVHYDKAARSILAGEGFGTGYYFSGLEKFQNQYSLPPVYPIFLAGIYAIFGQNFFAVRVIQSVVGALISLMIFLIGKEIFDKRVGFLAAALATVYPLLVFISGLLYVTVLFTLFMILFVWFTIKISDNDGILSPILAGLFLGLATLAGPILFAIYPFVGLWLLFIVKKSMRLKFKAAAILFGVAIITLIPWSIRNYAVFGRITPVSAAVDWFLAEAQSKIQNELTVQIRSDSLGHHFDVYVNGDYNGTLSDTTKIQGNATPLYAGVVLNSGVSSNLERFIVKRNPSDLPNRSDFESKGEIIDEFDRNELGADWLALPDFKVVDGTLQLGSNNVKEDFLAIFKGLANPSEVTIKWGYTTEASGMGQTGLALMLDSPHLEANGYLLKRQPFGLLELWLLEAGKPARLLTNMMGNKTGEQMSNGMNTKENPDASVSFVRKVFRILTDNPRDFLTHYAFEFIHFWQLYPDRVATKNDFTNWKTKLLSILTFGPVLVLGVLGFLLSFSNWRKASLMFFAIISFALGYSFFQTRIRYRIPIEPYMIIFAAYGFLILSKKVTKFTNGIFKKVHD
jgi:hypothetical protein